MVTEAKGIIFNIQKFSLHDGAGIRTLVFMKGCPLNCIWCSNPESQKFEKEIIYIKNKCEKCGKCVALCPRNCIDKTTFDIRREGCNKCEQCTISCYANSKKIVGKEVSVSEVIQIIEKDRIFYRNSNGGVTIGGGEPTAQPNFVKELLTECKRLSIHTAIETCGYGKWDVIGEVLEKADHVFMDIKHMDSVTHKKYTGVGNSLILENAMKLAQSGNDITFRIPLIPGINDDEKNISATGEFISSLTTINPKINVEILPYHMLGKNKYEWLNRGYELNETVPPEEARKNLSKKILETKGCKVINTLK